MTDEAATNHPVMLYDGVCGLCNKSVQTILKRDQRGTLRFAALQSSYGQAVIARHAGLKSVDSVAWVTISATGQERVLIRCDAALQAAAYLGGRWKLLFVAYILPRPVRDFFYDLVARYRYRLFGKYDSCPLPSPAVRSRFLDVV